jgi:toxin ParE1/3/4
VNKRVILLPAARDDILAIYGGISGDNPSAADRWLEAVRATTCQALPRNPLAGVRRDYGRAALAGLRMIGVTGFANYLIFYRVYPEAIQIIRVLHGARDIPNVLDPAE